MENSTAKQHFVFIDSKLKKLDFYTTDVMFKLKSVFENGVK